MSYKFFDSENIFTHIVFHDPDGNSDDIILNMDHILHMGYSYRRFLL